MKYICPICKKEFDREVDIIIDHTEVHIVNAIKKTHSKWVEKDGSCKKCYDWYRKQMRP